MRATIFDFKKKKTTVISKNVESKMVYKNKT
jgi:hypothetical protein